MESDSHSGVLEIDRLGRSPSDTQSEPKSTPKSRPFETPLESPLLPTQRHQPSVPPGEPGSPTSDPMLVFKGLPVSPGIAIGNVMVVDDDLRRVPRRTIRTSKVKDEIARLDTAIAASIAELNLVHEEAKREMGGETAKIFLFHVGMLADKSLINPIRKAIETSLVNAEYAVSQAFVDLAAKFMANPDSVFATKVNDIEDLAHRLLKHLGGDDRNARFRQVDPQTIVIARDLTPSQAAAFDRQRILAFATDLGGKTSHTAIIARALDLPAVVGCQALLKYARDGMAVILDGDRGTVTFNPDLASIDEYRRIKENSRLFRLSLTEIADLPSVTADGTPVGLLGNIELPEEAGKVLTAGGAGVGLYRTEYLYLTGNSEPSEEDHYNAYRTCIELVKGRELTIRTVDLGADKYTQAQEEIPERNPFLGCRSIRYCLLNLPMFKRQIRALLRASSLGPIKVMFPLITSLGELRHAKYLINDTMEELEEEGIAFDRSIKLGMMVEVPSAALLADLFAREVDFFSIGTNDLVQYTLAVDRTNERVAHLYNPTHPAVIKLIKDVSRSGRRHHIPVSCCGEAAADPEFALLLLGLGLRTLSVTSSAIAPLKRMIRSVTISQCERIARQAMSLDSDVQVAAFLRDQARKIVPEAFDGRSAEA